MYSKQKRAKVLLNKYQISFYIVVLVNLNLSTTSAIGQTLSTRENKYVIPFEITDANNIIFKTVLNQEDTINLFFDTGGTDIVMRHEAIKNSTTTLINSSEAYKQEDFEALGSLNTISIGTLEFDSLTIYPVDVGPQEADGHFGWNLFEGKIIALNYDKQELTVYDHLKKVPKDYVKLPIEYTHTLFCIQANAQVNNFSSTNRYLFDTGFQRALLLDKNLNKKDNFPDTLPVIKESKLKNSKGDIFINKIVELDEICFNEICAEGIPTHLLDLPNPAQFETHILGNELLMRFNTILDFKNHFVYLKPNQLMDLPYTDAN